MDKVSKWYESNVVRGVGCNVVVKYRDANVRDPYMGLMTDEEGYGFYSNRACHAILATLFTTAVNPIQVLHSSLFYPIEKRSCKDKTADRWWDFLFNPNTSPWRSLLPNITRHKRHFTVETMDINAGWVANFCVASRLPGEWPDLINTWGWLCDNGMDEVEALWAVTYFHMDDNKIIIPNKLDRGHYPFNLRGLTLKRLKEAKPTVVTGKIKDKSGYTPCNQMWENQTGTFHSDKFEEKDGYKGPFSMLWKANPNNFIGITADKALGVAKEIVRGEV